MSRGYICPFGLVKNNIWCAQELAVRIFKASVVTPQPHLETVERKPRNLTSELFAPDHIYDNPAYVS